MTAIEPRFLDSGDSGLTVEFGDAISEGVNDAVLALADALERRDLMGIREIIPTYRSLLVQFDPLVLSRLDLRRAVSALWPPKGQAAASAVTWRVPVLYGGEAGVDLADVAALHGLSEDEVIAIHAGATYRVYMVGFAPGFAYLGGLPQRLHTSRRTEPRLTTPPRSVSIGGEQAAVSPPIAIPSGWHLLGQTPVRSYDPLRTERPFLFSPGDRLRFAPVSRAEYDHLLAEAEAGGLIATRDDADA